MSEMTVRLHAIASDEFKAAFEQGFELGKRAANRMLERNARVASKCGDVRAMKDYTHLRHTVLMLDLQEELEAD